MRLTEKIAQMELSRQELLMVWMRRKGLKHSDVARALGVSPSTVRAWFEAETIPSWRHEKLVAYGIPVELLPIAENIPPGPRREMMKSVQAEACADNAI